MQDNLYMSDLSNRINLKGATMARKGQTAMEYLMTYGWAILIIVVVGAVLFAYGVFSPAKLIPKGACTSGSLYIDAKDWLLTSGGQFTMQVQNRVGDTINIVNTTINDGTATQSSLTSQNVSAGAKSGTITVSSLTSGNTGDSRTLAVSVGYTVPSGAAGTRTYSCTLTGKIGE